MESRDGKPDYPQKTTKGISIALKGSQSMVESTLGTMFAYNRMEENTSCGLDTTGSQNMSQMHHF